LAGLKNKVDLQKQNCKFYSEKPLKTEFNSKIEPRYG